MALTPACQSSYFTRFYAINSAELSKPYVRLALVFAPSQSREAAYEMIAIRINIEPLFIRIPRGLTSRFRLAVYWLLGMKQGKKNRMEGGGRCRRLRQIQIGDYNAFTQGCWLWPEDTPYQGIRIRIGNGNYFNRNLMIDACGYVEIGDENMFGPDVYITDSNHTFGLDVSPKVEPMQAGRVLIGNRCWIGAKAVILKDVELGDGCVVGAGAVVTHSVPPGLVVAGIPARPIDSHNPQSEKLLTQTSLS
jgi:acetyltransferase-like isoleucine patch superfamily enzyme